MGCFGWGSDGLRPQGQKKPLLMTTLILDYLKMNQIYINRLKNVPRLHKRSKQFQATMNSEDIRADRENRAIELRKTKRADLAIKRRNIDEQAKDLVNTEGDLTRLYSQEDMSELLLFMKSTDDVTLLKAAVGFRKLLSFKKNPPIQAVIDAGIVPYLIS